MRLKNQVALVTGGSRGIGRAICHALDGEGARVIVHYHQNRAAAEEVQAGLQQPATLAQADIGSSTAITRMVAALPDNSIDILVNNAGVWRNTPMGSSEEAVVDNLLDTNLKGVFWITQALLPKLREGARIVNMSSVAGRIGIPDGRSLYGATKAAVDSLTKSWALELAPRKIRVNALAPGFVDTDMTAALMGDPESRKWALSLSPLGRFATAEDCARLAVFLATDDSASITGQSFNVSAGSFV